MDSCRTGSWFLYTLGVSAFVLNPIRAKIDSQAFIITEWLPQCQTLSANGRSPISDVNSDLSRSLPNQASAVAGSGGVTVNFCLMVM